MPGPFHFDLLHVDSGTLARHGQFHTPHGPVDTPAFMPVGTQGAVKGVTLDQLRQTGAQMMLANTYHLALRPGEAIVEQLGGLHGMSGWSGPILTDSGGFQLFSLAQMIKVNETGAVFRSHIDGRLLDLTPERAVEIQEKLGSDVAMVLDHVVALPAEPDVVADATRRTLRWARRAKEHADRAERTSRTPQAQFGIVQGGLDPALRAECAAGLCELDFPGYAIGGLSVGETPDEMYRVLDGIMPLLPSDRPRYLMGVGTPVDLLEAVARGVDLFDCVMPTRNGRNAMAFTDSGGLKLRNEIHARDPRPVQEGCPCPCCAHSRGYIRHLFMAREMLGPILLSIHNLTYYQRLLADARSAVSGNGFAAFRAAKLAGWRGLGS
ncbi:MAG TPA: tRNA guanosine(34) transglycosylase Tgt [Pirellulales bacterium]|jgi:queuine tRNA-ribosyltransferase